MCVHIRRSGRTSWRRGHLKLGLERLTGSESERKDGCAGREVCRRTSVGFALPVSGRRHYGEWVSLWGEPASLDPTAPVQERGARLKAGGWGASWSEVGTGWGGPSRPTSAPPAPCHSKPRAWIPCAPPTPEGGAGGGTSAPDGPPSSFVPLGPVVLLDSGGTCDLPGKLFSSVQ